MFRCYEETFNSNSGTLHLGTAYALKYTDFKIKLLKVILRNLCKCLSFNITHHICMCTHTYMYRHCNTMASTVIGTNQDNKGTDAS